MMGVVDLGGSEIISPVFSKKSLWSPRNKRVKTHTIFDPHMLVHISPLLIMTHQSMCSVSRSLQPVGGIKAARREEQSPLQTADSLVGYFIKHTSKKI